MASPISWLLRLTALCYLIVPLSGQHHGVSKCSITCTTMTRNISEKLLTSYRRNQASCGKPAIILTTIKGRRFCANPEEEWVRKAMENLDRKAAAAVRNYGVFEKQISNEATSTPAAGDMDRSAGSEPIATGKSRILETQTALGTSPELASWENRSPTASKPPDGGPSPGHERTELFSATAVTRSWRSSAYQPGSDLWTKGEASEGPSTQAPFTQTLPTQASSTQTLPTQAPSTQTLPTQAPFTQTPFTQTLPTQAPSTQTPFTQAPSTQSPSLSHRAPKDNTGSEGPSMQIGTQDPTSEGSLGSTDVSMGSGSVLLVSEVLTPSERAPYGNLATSSSGAPGAKESLHDPEAPARRQAVGLLAFLGLLFGLGVAMFAYQSLQGCPRNMAGDMVEGLRHVPRSCGSNSYVLVPV